VTTHVVTRQQIAYAFGPDIPPVLEVESGDLVTFETLDASSGRIPGGMDIVEYTRVRDPSKVNPASGPVAVRGAVPGDELRVEIVEIGLEGLGWCRLTPGSGVMRDEVTRVEGMLFRLDGDMLVTPRGIRFPTRPMVGVIGTCPADRTWPTADPGLHGGNMDFNDVKVGTICHLPVWLPGGLFGLGDVHAAMGDGEVSGTAVEICGRVTVRVEIVPRTRLAKPWFEQPDEWMTYGVAPTLDEAIRIAVADMATFLQERLGATRAEAFMLVSARGDVRIGQSAHCGLDHTARVLFPKLGA
jgi:amidase